MASLLDRTPTLSLVVATFGRKSEVMDLLRSIPSRNFRQLEVVIVDQNEQPLFKELSGTCFPFQLTHLCTPLQNANAARNLGAAYAKAAWLMFPDDDATFEADALDQLLLLIHQDRYDLISGQIVDRDGTPHLLHWLEHPGVIDSATLDHTLVESSFAIRRDCFSRIGGFDPLFGPGAPFPSAEGADLVRRLWLQGPLRAWFTPEITLQHAAKSLALTAEARERIYTFAIGEGAFTARHHGQLPMLRVLRKLLFRAAAMLIASGEQRRRKAAFLRGFRTGVLAYRRLQRNRLQSPSISPRSFEA